MKFVMCPFKLLFDFLNLLCLYLIGGSIFLVLSGIVSAECLVGGKKKFPFPCYPVLREAFVV